MRPLSPEIPLNLKAKGDLAELTVAIDLLAVYDATSDRCYYVPAKELGAGRSTLCLRLTPARNGQRLGTRPAEDYLDP